MSLLQPMTTEEDLLQDDMMEQPEEYTSYGPFPERKRRTRLLQAIADLLRRLRQSLRRRR
ncbi:hypothetical protein C8T65DRAFT_568681 [Cerioporus squamosus]|nr:hypothetical protein C8T65DRAFT_568681 [Cerioporus squamosus]